ncbi:hypothetical protein BJX61DRAFT_497190 [Aspergillus egyptiacus]|nr:hypothetical protein BJX61DRAFT_497190 [Aspergillus egyptiacus]
MVRVIVFASCLINAFAYILHPASHLLGLLSRNLSSCFYDTIQIVKHILLCTVPSCPDCCLFTYSLLCWLVMVPHRDGILTLYI